MTFNPCACSRSRQARCESPIALVIAQLVLAAPVCGQELEPRAYSPAPVGTIFLVAGATRSSGDVLLDLTLPIDDADATLGAVTVGAGYVFGVLGRQASVLAAAPYARARVRVTAGDLERTASLTGFADPRLKLSINLAGAPALRRDEFLQRRPQPVLGLSLSIAPPLGEYEPARRVNLGAHRWAWKPEIGVSWPHRRWTLEGYGGVWVFTRNQQYFPGSAMREQQPILAFQAHASYTFRPRLWAAADVTWYSGGSTVIDGVERGDLQRNSRVGATVSLPLGTRYSIQAAYSTGATTRIGADFDTVTLAWQATWLSR